MLRIQRAQERRCFSYNLGFCGTMDQLADALFAHAQIHEVTKTEQTRFGRRYVVEGELQTLVGRRPMVRVVWFIEQAPYSHDS